MDSKNRRKDFRQAGLSSGEVALARNRRSVKFQESPEKVAPRGSEVDDATVPQLPARVPLAPTHHDGAPARPVTTTAQSAEKENLALKHRAGLLHRPPPMHLKSSYQQDFGQRRLEPSNKTPILEANRMLMRDGQGQANGFSTPGVLPFQGDTEYQRNYQRWAQPVERHADSLPGRHQRSEADDVQVEDLEDVDDAVDTSPDWPAGGGAAARFGPTQAFAASPPHVPAFPQHQPEEPLPLAGRGRALQPAWQPSAEPRHTAPPPPLAATAAAPYGAYAYENSRDMEKHERARRFRSEYQRTFCEPVERVLKAAEPDRAPAVTVQGKPLPPWYDRVMDLRRRADLYRTRSLGTFFSRSYFDDLEESLAKWETDSRSSSARPVKGEAVPPDQGGHTQRMPGDAVQSGTPQAGSAAQSAAPVMAPRDDFTNPRPGSYANHPLHQPPPLGRPAVPQPVSRPATTSSCSSSTWSVSTLSSPSSSGALPAAQSEQGAVTAVDGGDSGRVATPDLPPRHIRHHLDRTTPGTVPARVKLDAAKPKPHGRVVTDPTVRGSGSPAPIPRAQTAPAPPTNRRPSTTEVKRHPAPRRKAAQGIATASKSASCTPSAQLGPGPYRQRQPYSTAKPSKPMPAASSAKHEQPVQRRAAAAPAAAARPKSGPWLGGHGLVRSAPALAHNHSALCDSLSSISSQGSTAAADVLRRATRRKENFWNERQPPVRSTVAAH